MTDRSLYPVQSPSDVPGLPQSNTPQKAKTAAEDQKQSKIDISETSGKMCVLPILSEFDLKLTEEQLEVFRNITRLLASTAINLTEKEAIIAQRKQRRKTKVQPQVAVS